MTSPMPTPPPLVRARLRARQWRRDLLHAAARLLARALRRLAELLDPPPPLVERGRVHRSTLSGGPLAPGQLVLNLDPAGPTDAEQIAAVRRGLHLAGRWPS